MIYNSGVELGVLLTTVVILIHSFQPADIIVSMRHQMDVNVPFLTSVTSLQQKNSTGLSIKRHQLSASFCNSSSS